MKKITGTQVITLLATVVTITVNALANILPINGLATGEISDRFEIYFVPAGYVFSIWGLIYLGLIGYTIFQFLPSQSENQTLKKIAPYYWLSSLANTIWIFLWHYEVFSVTLAAMLVILGSLLVMNRKLADAQGYAKWLVKLPFSIYLGWISVATIANVSQTLYFINWDGFGLDPAIWAVIMLGTASLLGILMAWRENDFPYGLVLIWAFVGITVSQSGTALVVNSAWSAVGLLTIALLVSLVKNRKLY